MIECIIFDLDDTLYSEWSFIQQGFVSVSEKLLKDFRLGGKYTSQEIYKVLEDIYFYHTRVKIFDQLHRFIPEIEVDEQYIVSELVPAYRYSEKVLQCYPDVKPALNALKGNMKIGMVTNGNARVQNYKIDLLAIREYFDSIEVSGYYSEDKAKPSPYMLLKILDSIHVHPRDVIYVGDNPETDRCSVEAGCRFVRVYRTKQHPHIDDRIINELNSISNLVDLLAMPEVSSSLYFEQ